MARLQDWEAAGGTRAHAISKFFLVDDSGHNILAVIGIEQPEDGHYCYKSLPAFEQLGALETRARRDVFSWLDEVIETSKLSGGMPVVEADAPEEGLGAAAGLDAHLVFTRFEYASSPDPVTKLAADDVLTLCSVVSLGLVVVSAVAACTLVGSCQPSRTE